MINEKEEIWKMVLNSENHMVSNLGRVKSLKPGKRYPSKKEIIMKESLNRYGYPIFRKSDGKNTTVHRCVWQAFNGEIPSTVHINHKNGIRNDNRLENLETCTNRENILHAVRNGFFKKRHDGHGGSKDCLTLEDIMAIKFFYIEKKRNQSKILGKIFNRDRHSIRNIAKSKNYDVV